MTVDAPNRMTRRQFVAGTGAAGLVAIAGCTANPNLSANAGGQNSTGCGTKTLSGSVDIAGSSTVFPLAKAVSVEFQKRHQDVRVSLSKTGTGGGFENFFCTGKTDFNNASRPITDGETKQCRSQGVNPLELRVATDALTVIVNKNADWVDCMTVDELRQIWKPGGAKKWSDIRPEWPDVEFDLYGAADTSGTFDYFTHQIVGEEGRQRNDYQATEKDNIVVQGVSGNKHAMGYLGFAYYRQSKEKVKAIAIDNGNSCVKPSIQTAKKGEYQPLSRPLFTYVSEEALAKPQVAEFARFFLKQSANEDVVVDAVGYVPNTDKRVNEELAALEKIVGAQGQDQGQGKQ
ncbi:PstS family phosphate ABC transporter substrate-binding protein [Halocatena marina]|uniref:PstS family phosphate ABC transporter substrate-binding protein n=1 Tax=Halocatena marina TaxID=2934937 RepID=UPI00200ECBF2|nr:phosphate ABC transporter substrate-binding protein PstS family protein [Halocatena marina]